MSTAQEEGTTAEGRNANGASTRVLSVVTASEEELSTVEGIGARLAARIVEYREAHDGVDSLDELRSVRGIGARRFERLKDSLTTEDPRLVTVYCPHCLHAAAEHVRLPWPGGPTRCASCTRWIGRNRALAEPAPPKRPAPRRREYVTAQADDIVGAAVRAAASGSTNVTTKLRALALTTRANRRERRAAGRRPEIPGLKGHAARFAGRVMVTSGTLILAYGTVTLVWQDPVTAFVASHNQKQATREFDGLLRDARAAGRLETQVAIERDAAALNIDTPPGHALGRIDIARIGAHFTVVQGTDESSLEKGPGHYMKSPLPGAAGNWTVGIAGHRTTYLAPFRHIDELQQGDPIVLRMPYATFRYAVYRSRVVDPGDQTILARKPYNRLALTACHPPFSAAHRLIVYAKLRSVSRTTKHS